MLSITGVAGLLICLIYFRNRNTAFRHREYFILLLGLLLANTLVLWHFNYGLFASYSTSRLSLPMNFLLAIFAAIAFKFKPKEMILGSLLVYAVIIYIQTFAYTRIMWLDTGLEQVLFCLACMIMGLSFVFQKEIKRLTFVFGILALSIVAMPPKLHSRPYYWNYESPQIVQKCQAFVEKEASEDTLFVTRLQLVPILMNQNSITPADFINIRKSAVTAIKKDHYKNIYLLTTESESKSYPLNMDIAEFNELIPGFDLEKVYKERVFPDLFLAVHRLSPNNE